MTKAQATRYFNTLLQALFRVGGSKLVTVAALTLIRTALLNYQGRLQGHLFKTAFLKHVRPFLRLLVENVGLSLASSLVESTSKHVLEMLAIQWQDWVSRRLHKQYFAHMVRTRPRCGRAAADAVVDALETHTPPVVASM